MTESKDFRAGTRSLKWEKVRAANVNEILIQKSNHVTDLQRQEAFTLHVTT